MRRTRPPKHSLIQIKQKDLAAFRKKMHNRQQGIDPILKQAIPFEDTVVDHKHGRKDIPVGENGKGLIRGVIQTQVNALEGKIANAYVRYGLSKFAGLPEILRGIADYLENPPLGYRYIHPSEIQKPKKVKKNSYKKMVKAFKLKYPKRTPPPLSKRGTLTKPVQEAFEDLEIKIEYLK